MARILWHEKTIDVFTTHMVSYFSKVKLSTNFTFLYLCSFQSLENKITRYLQAMETVSYL